MWPSVKTTNCVGYQRRPRHGRPTIVSAGILCHPRLETSLPSKIILPEPAPMLPARSCEAAERSEEHTSELQSLMRISYAVFCLKIKNPTSLCNATQIQPTTYTHQ